MINDKIVLDRETFKALAIETRIKILKLLNERYQLTLTDIAKELNLAPSTVKEHLDKLISAGLIRQVDKGMKWKYYRLTIKGNKIMNPYEKRVMIILGIGIVAMFISIYSMLYKLENLTRFISIETAPAALRLGGKAHENITTEISKYAEITTSLPPEVGRLHVPYLEIIIVILSALIVGICVGYLIKRRSII
ncbi:MAG: hypothetical protein DRO90_01870 [Candidatus Altiarchaeales archaeon]|nr:MAG: hypothetical protein DRO95_00410 [Candidatus Altiarchaeales archaeon]RLI94527.1 MAG: hypothetical protein DRO90_01870 [Candidatus Altiarchaeales archaeon]RLI95539.1 MAG: hypothetical protein DRO94_00205 [Candidatus Altiarchaeales archaeon]HDO82557.1 ArsR family transcriptional regulator [Candidatus Altiarchaeales archaeon]HEX55206.1 ArsR family transcriptional regulator [Candidatus Altiarchaeales archaeon]